MKIIRMNLLDTVAEIDPDNASESVTFDLDAAKGPRSKYVVVVQGIVDVDRYIVTLQDEAGTVVDMSSTFSIAPEQLEIPDLTVTVEVVCTRIPRGTLRCVRVADLAARPAEPLAS